MPILSFGSENWSLTSRMRSKILKNSIRDNQDGQSTKWDSEEKTGSECCGRNHEEESAEIDLDTQIYQEKFESINNEKKAMQTKSWILKKYYRRDNQRQKFN